MDLATLSLPTLEQITIPLLLLGLFVAGSLLILLYGWRTSLLALLAQYVLLGLWLAKLYRPELLLVKTLVGAVTVAMIYLVAAEVQWGMPQHPARREPAAPDEVSLLDEADAQAAPSPSDQPALRMGPGFRLAAVVLAAVVAYGLATNYPLPGLPTDVNLAFYWLCAAGLMCLLISGDVVYAGLGALGLISGLDLFYVAMVDIPDMVILGLLAGLNLVAALVVARAADAAVAPEPRLSPAAGKATGGSR